MTTPTDNADVVLIGGGIMSATLGALLNDLQPDWDIRVYEKLDYVARESSHAWNNAGTGHAALCELNYSPRGANGDIDITKAVTINEQFHQSRQYWSFLVKEGIIADPSTFISPVPHMSYARGDKGRDYIRDRYETMVRNPLFADMEYTDDAAKQAEWLPLMFDNRGPGQVNGVSKVSLGTDVDFGSLTRQLLGHVEDNGVQIRTAHTVTDLERSADGWKVSVRDDRARETTEVNAKFVFVGAGGGALHLLQKSGIAEGRGYGGFPVSGLFLRTSDPELVDRHHAKVYGQAATGAPPMSVPHLDTRVIDGKSYLLFGPYAGFSPKFLKGGSLLDLPTSVRGNNLPVMLNVAKDNFDLVTYLMSQLAESKKGRFQALEEFTPEVDPEKWDLITAGQRVQVMKRDPQKGGVLGFGTEVVSAADGSIAALLGASPGASTVTSIMLGLLERCFPQQYASWEPRLKDMVPSLGRQLHEDESLLKEISDYSAGTLQIG
ncbi:MAG: malate:quinone oxidoreductase [Brevibacterium yomogidense]|uniref:Probable malate:quinone oxidoreductase n=1 Tax=Brevibacterium yomogidense TaxID=946573 RepID=A0A1X6X9B4_9MICO|nr:MULTISPECIES: malate:quinone oxidoreductase [Brevibacterium]SLM95729.1 Malate:quinone oxidoreductase [Brevibacterium yomogidense]SMX65219.1 malate dehydrogenase (quinone) [Brevibacterium sp. Mu109]